MKNLKNIDPKIYTLIDNEKQRQKQGLELIPSENYTSEAVLEAMGSILTNKYSEGYPEKRYYGGQIWIDEIEKLAQKRLIELFVPVKNRDNWHANVQPYSGSPANIAVLFGLLNFGDRVMGMALDQGGHLTHGHKVNFSGKAYEFTQYSVDPKTHLIDYAEVEKLAKKVKPKLIISGATAYPRIIDFKKFQNIADKVNAIHMADISHIAGLVVAKVHPTPFPFTDVVTTTTHKTLRGPRSAVIMCQKKYADAIDKAVFPGLQGGPHDHTTAAKAVCFLEAKQKSFIEYGHQIVKNTHAFAKRLTENGFQLVSGGSDNHLILIDLTNIKMPGKVAQTVLDEVGITLNKNTIPYDLRSPFDPSGIRLGTPALTTRGMKEKEFIQIANLMAETLAQVKVTEKKIDNKFNTKFSYDKKRIANIKQKVKQLAVKFPVPGIKN
ncbi:MAG: glycine hydroxymethyltransferase [Candidatus Berkelbacteria bacterium Licking1014_85]|uniref:Serine hydroxymethyltransferase n=1 Tax=Candidatus Berkelbacteria bacterium Licking1014_85 TaxID=2017148 RepID=A0A554LKF5_9BACT|nr:MAG: glycine hydroxymethyltransferase [Candidatus Berkelbacteria bacterium Licking1014_85]